MLPGKALAERPAAGGPEPDPDPRVAERRAMRTGGPDAETRVLFRDIDDPGLTTLEGYRERGGYRALETRATASSSPTRC